MDAPWNCASVVAITKNQKQMNLNDEPLIKGQLLLGV